MARGYAILAALAIMACGAFLTAEAFHKEAYDIVRAKTAELDALWDKEDWYVNVLVSDYVAPSISAAASFTKQILTSAYTTERATTIRDTLVSDLYCSEASIIPVVGDQPFYTPAEMVPVRLSLLDESFVSDSFCPLRMIIHKMGALFLFGV